MIIELRNEFLILCADTESGIVTKLMFYNDPDEMNWLISPDTLRRYGYSDSNGFLLGKSVLHTSFENETGNMRPTVFTVTETSVTFEYILTELTIRHTFELVNERLHWLIAVTNHTTHDVAIDKLYHWMPVAYIMHENIDENYANSCAMVPSISGEHSYVVCKKRSGEGPNLLIINPGNGMKSIGSLCKYKNLFFEKSAPSLSGLVLYCTVNAYPGTSDNDHPSVDWMYRDMYRGFVLQSGECFQDAYQFYVCPNGQEDAYLAKAGIARVDYPPIILCGNTARISVDYCASLAGYSVFAANQYSDVLETSISLEDVQGTSCIQVGPFHSPGERKLQLIFKDGTSTFVIFAVYESMSMMTEAFCHDIFAHRFIDDPESMDYCGYKSISRQGESCSKGALLLLKNLLAPPVAAEIKQVERNAAFYLRTRWLDENFIAKKQYPGGFARIIDMDYLIMEFYLLSLFDDNLLAINQADTYLLWAYRTAAYRMEVTPDKLPREAVEVALASMISWLQIEMIDRLRQKGYPKQADHLDQLWKKQLDILKNRVQDRSFVETEHYFDNAGISVTAEALLNAGDVNTGLAAARLLLPNVASSNDYRNFSPDRWWEALACMYHNLWAVFSAKAMLTAYEKSHDNRFLFSAYRSMMPMFFNYDWNAFSTQKMLAKGEGVSAYCITNPNLNLAYASRNRFGQSVFQDEFFADMDISGDDWDLGADMVVYLSTFGQQAYVTMHNGKPVCVNGELEGSLGSMRITSFAAYAGRYYIEPFDMTISRGNSGFVIKTITILNGECTEVEASLLANSSDIQILCTRNGLTSPIQPFIKYV